MWHRGTDAGAAWLESLPRLVGRCAERWSLELGDPFPDSRVALVVPATTPDGNDAVLKIQYVDRETAHEAAALARWNGDGAVRLLDHDPTMHALLLERCTPGTHLADRDPDEALDVLIALLPRLWKQAGDPFTTLVTEARHWSRQLPGRWERASRPFERELLDTALAFMHDLGESQREQVLLHQDLHADNVLAAQREPWLAIDPKPLVGEREFAVAPIVRGEELGHSRALVVHRLDRLSSELGLDRERARGWTIAQTLAWAFENDRVLPRHVETVRWLADGR